MIQQGLKAPKGQYNNFGKYKYRSCEDILEAVKPLLEEQACTLVLSDDIVLIGDRFYLKATATLTNSEGVKEVATAFAREQDTKTGMDSCQLTGATSSYARKYALNGLFCIDDTKDADTMDNTHEGQSAPKQEDTRPWMNEKQLMSALERISAGILETEKQCEETFRMKKEYREKIESAVTAYKSLYNMN